MSLQHTVQTNRTLLVDGPAAIQVIAGKAEVFGKPLKEPQRVMVHEGKRKPFYATETLTLKVLLGANAAIKEVEGTTTPASWDKPVEFIRSLELKPLIIILMGASDAGKSSFCTYLLNRLVEGNRRVGILDGDLGQSDIGPSATVGYAVAEKQVTELGNLKMQNGFFVGATSPVHALNRAVEGLVAMLQELLQKQPDYVIINTDGFIAGEAAEKYKLSLIRELRPNIVIGIQSKNELDPIISCLGGGGVMTVEASPAAGTRGPEKRKALRERTYQKHLKNSKLQCIPISQLIVEPRTAIPKTQDPNKGLLVGLYGYGSKFLGIGVLRAINSTRKTLKIQTSVPKKPIRLVLGKVMLDRKLREVPSQA
jgi:polynucleotide 5'-hydroxyl-kinase GRC3/NOL9